jgi:hypothetical protein
MIVDAVPATRNYGYFSESSPIFWNGGGKYDRVCSLCGYRYFLVRQMSSQIRRQLKFSEEFDDDDDDSYDDDDEYNHDYYHKLPHSQPFGLYRPIVEAAPTYYEEGKLHNY